MHPDQLELRADTVRKLVDEQFPEWRTLPISSFRSPGTVNALFRIGETLCARFPLQHSDETAARLVLEAEADAARELRGRTSFATPRPIAIGEPGFGYPMPWAVQTWIAGEDAFTTDPGSSTGFALDLASFITAVRRIDTRERIFTGSGRGGNLRSHDDWVATCIHHGARLFDPRRVTRLWNSLRELPRTSPDVMTHGDLIPGNVLVADQRLVGVIDVGGLGPADPALDLVAAWHLLEAEPRDAFRRKLDCDDVEWHRGIAWALEQALGAAWYYAATNTAMSRMGQRTIGRILEATTHRSR